MTPFEFWYPNGPPDDLTPEEWEELAHILRDKILSRMAAEEQIQCVSYWHGLPLHKAHPDNLGLN